MSRGLDDFDVTEIWEQPEFAKKEYIGVPPEEECVAAIECELGFKLPKTNVALMKYLNRSILKKTNHRTIEGTSWAKDPIAITGFYSIGIEILCSLCGRLGSQFWIDKCHQTSCASYCQCFFIHTRAEEHPYTTERRA